MSHPSGVRSSRAADYDRLQATAVAGVIGGVVLLAVAAFLVSYGGIHAIAVRAGVSPALAGLYPLLFDAALVVACASVLALRGAAWWMRAYAAMCYLVLVAAVAVIGAIRAAGIDLPERGAAATLAAMPWLLFLLGFGLGLSLLRHRRTVRALGAGDPPRSGAGAAFRERAAAPRPREPKAGPRSREPGGNPRPRGPVVNPRRTDPVINPRPPEPVVHQRAADPVPPLNADFDEPYVRLIPAPPKPADGNSAESGDPGTPGSA
jgi:hypothetical protein